MTTTKTYIASDRGPCGPARTSTPAGPHGPRTRTTQPFLAEKRDINEATISMDLLFNPDGRSAA